MTFNQTTHTLLVINLMCLWREVLAEVMNTALIKLTTYARDSVGVEHASMCVAVGWSFVFG